jgi:hypothetical protein
VSLMKEGPSVVNEVGQCFTGAFPLEALGDGRGLLSWRQEEKGTGKNQLLEPETSVKYRKDREVWDLIGCPLVQARPP